MVSRGVMTYSSPLIDVWTDYSVYFEVWEDGEGGSIEDWVRVRRLQKGNWLKGKRGVSRCSC